MNTPAGFGGRAAIIAGRTVIVLIWLLAGVMVAATVLELALGVKGRWQMSHDGRPRFHELERAYHQCDVLHVHPQYLFFFPLDPRERDALSNSVCSVDADGFRGPGPSHAGGRPLAFLLGGSAVFGAMASSDATTITGYLNRLQDQYFFVNAGVPSWNSTQEMFRVAFQLLDYRPALIVSYDGANDAELIDFFGRRMPGHAAGMPEDFDSLSDLVDAAARMPSPRRALVSLLPRLFPELKDRFNDSRYRAALDTDRSQPLPEEVLQQGVARYLSNLTRMRDLATARGARFVAVFQPMAQLHRHLGPGAKFFSLLTIERFHRAAVEQIPGDLDFYDLGNVFDQYYAAIPVVNPDVTDQTVFTDPVHLYDPGNQIVARHLIRLIQ